LADEAAEELVKLGLTEYLSKVYSSLASLGPSGVTEINRLSGVPRTKVYETLEQLVSKGMVEFQPGRPAVYRAVRPAVLIKRLTEDYLNSAQNAERLLEGRYESVRDVDQDLVWIVRGDATIRRKLAEFVTSAKQSILILEVYPPTFIASVKSLLKSASSNGIIVRAVCMVGKDQTSLREFPEPDLIEYLTIFSPPSSSRKRSAMHTPQDDPYLKSLSLTFSGPYGVALIDEVESLVMIPNPTDRTRSIGFSAKIPGVPSLMRITFERLFASGKRMNVRA
jgi:sugar-specific transcriptional regulator TrmB